MSEESEKQRKPTSDAALTLLLFEVLLFGLSFPGDDEWRQLADELEENHPPDLTPEGLSIVLQILREKVMKPSLFCERIRICQKVQSC